VAGCDRCDTILPIITSRIRGALFGVEQTRAGAFGRRSPRGRAERRAVFEINLITRRLP
jgi:hypothetical protein